MLFVFNAYPKLQPKTNKKLKAKKILIDFVANQPKLFPEKKLLLSGVQEQTKSICFLGAIA